MKMQIDNVKIINAKIASTVKIVQPVNLYNCILGERVFIGPFTEIQGNVTIGEDTRVQSHTFICEHVTINERCFIGHGVMFVNDKFQGGTRAFGDQNKILKTIIGNDVLIGSGATILPVSICSNVIIGAGSVVTKDITEPGTYLGNPARKLNEKNTL